MTGASIVAFIAFATGMLLGAGVTAYRARAVRSMCAELLAQKSALERELEVWRDFTELVTDGLWVLNLDAEGNPGAQVYNDDFFTEFGLDPSVRTNTPDDWMKIIYAQDGERAMRDFARHRDSGEPYLLNVRYRHADHDEPVHIMCRAVMVRGEDGTSRMFGAHTNITALMEAQEKLRVKNDELATFARGVSHDTKGPMRQCLALVEMLIAEWDEATAEQRQKWMASAVRALRRGLALSDDLLVYSHSTTQVYKLRPVEANDAAEDVVSELESVIKATGASVDVGALGSVLADPQALYRIFQNLIGNALKFVGPGVVPNIRIYRRGDEICIEDNGIGIPEHQRERVFAAFTRLHTHDSYEGSGFGLAIVAQIAAKLRGRVMIESVESCGTRFVLQLQTTP